MSVVTTLDDWRHLAACRDMDPNLFFPVRRRRDADAVIATVCARCPVRVECRGEVEHLAFRGRHGIWGGEWFRGVDVAVHDIRGRRPTVSTHMINASEGGTANPTAGTRKDTQ